MLTMAEKSLLGLAVTLTIVCAGLIVFPAVSYNVSLVTSPNSETFYIPVGEPFNITCKGSGDDGKKFSSLKWYNKKGQVIPFGIPGTQEEEKHSLTLTFIDPKEEESGVYKCIAVYANRQSLEKSVSIIFHQNNKPLFDQNYDNFTATEKSSLMITCIAKGEEPIKYKWYNQNAEEIKEDPNSSIFVNNTSHESNLIIPTATLDHTGLYTCLASNNHGLNSKIFELTVLPSDGTETSFRDASILNVTTTTVNFGFNVIGTVEYIDVMYLNNRSKEEKTFKFQYGVKYEIKDLIPAGMYNFKFRVSPSVNNHWSRPYTVVLLPEKPEVIFQTINSGTVKLEWLFKFEDRMKKTIDMHEISYSTVQMEGGNKWKPGTCPITIQIPECRSSSYTISGLEQNVYYEIQLRAHTAGGYGEPYRQKIIFPRC